MDVYRSSRIAFALTATVTVLCTAVWSCYYDECTNGTERDIAGQANVRCSSRHVPKCNTDEKGAVRCSMVAWEQKISGYLLLQASLLSMDAALLAEACAATPRPALLDARLIPCIFGARNALIHNNSLVFRQDFFANHTKIAS
ncbi:uncharacterized protein [Dermacentor albipictus]|uniref:uncharacterized protein n=1 Tax=Dermacentor albipictus TaxID=60249 RepID=UPI0038FCB8D0